MDRILKIFPPLLLLIFLMSCQPTEDRVSTDKVNKVISDGTPPVFSFKKTAHDFGSLEEGEIVEFTFIFENTGGTPLIINSAKASCGCTAADYSKNPIAPGEKGKVKIEFDSAGFRNNQHKSVTVSANTAEKTVKLSIGAFVESKMQLQ